MRIVGAAAMLAVLWGGYGLLGIGLVCLASTALNGVVLRFSCLALPPQSAILTGLGDDGIVPPHPRI